MRKAWQRQETRLASRLPGGSRQPGSGSGWSRKHDVRSPEYLVEAKTTEHASYTLKLPLLIELGHNADVEGRTPVLAVDIQGHRYVVFREQDLE